VTIGDNMPLFDPPVSAESYLGCVRGAGSGTPRRDAAHPRGNPASDLARTTVWSRRPPADKAIVAHLSALGATLRTAEPAVLEAELAAAPHGMRIGVSSSGAACARSIPTLIASESGHRHLLVGYRYGYRSTFVESLPPGIVGYHVRPDDPLLEISLERTLAVIVAAFGRVRLSDGTVGLS
jgi:hypothetical protein